MVGAAPQKQDSVQAVAGVRPCEKKGPFPLVAGKRGRSLGQSAGPEQEVAPRRRQGRIVAEGVGADLVHQPEARFGPEGHAVGDCAIEIDYGRGRHDAQPVIERGDARPVGLGGLARAGVAGGEGGLQHIGAVAAQRFGAGQRIEAPADQQMVPARAILLRSPGARNPDGASLGGASRRELCPLWPEVRG